MEEKINFKRVPTLILVGRAFGTRGATLQYLISKSHCLEMSYYVIFLGGLDSNEFHIIGGFELWFREKKSSWHMTFTQS